MKVAKQIVEKIKINFLWFYYNSKKALIELKEEHRSIIPYTKENQPEKPKKNWKNIPLKDWIHHIIKPAFRELRKQIRGEPFESYRNSFQLIKKRVILTIGLI